MAYGGTLVPVVNVPIMGTTYPAGTALGAVSVPVEHWLVQAGYVLPGTTIKSAKAFTNGSNTYAVGNTVTGLTSTQLVRLAKSGHITAV